MLTHNLRTHILELTKDREIPITEQQYKALKSAQKLAGYNDALEIRDPDTWKMLHDGLWKDFAWFRELERSKHVWASYICDFWISHPIHESCSDIQKFKVSPIVFRTALWALYPNVKYPSQVTPEMRTKVLYSLNP